MRILFNNDIPKDYGTPKFKYDDIKIKKVYRYSNQI